MPSFDHTILVTHNISVDEAGETAVLFNMKTFKAMDQPLDVIDLFKLKDMNPDAHNVMLSSVHLYQMIVRNSIGLNKLIKEVKIAAQMGAVGPMFAKELVGWMEELQELNRIVRHIVQVGPQEAVKELDAMKKGPQIVT